MKIAELKQTFIQIHNDSFQVAKSEIPALEVSEVLQIVIGVAQKDMSIPEVCEYLHETYGKAVEVYAKAFAKNGIQEGLHHMKELKEAGLDAPEFVDECIDLTQSMRLLLDQFTKGEIPVENLIHELSNTQFEQVATKVLHAFLPNVEILAEADCEKVGNITIPTFSYLALCMAFEILSDAVKKAELQHEQTARILEESKRTVTMIRTYRLEMDVAMNQYMSDRLLKVTTEGFTAMDQAILAQDINGYIKGNTVIQELLNHEVQFHNRQEFDSLMDSEEMLKL